MAMAEAKSILFHVVRRYYLRPSPMAAKRAQELATNNGGSNSSTVPRRRSDEPFHVVGLTAKPNEVWIDFQRRRDAHVRSSSS